MVALTTYKQEVYDVHVRSWCEGVHVAPGISMFRNKMDNQESLIFQEFYATLLEAVWPEISFLVAALYSRFLIGETTRDFSGSKRERAKAILDDLGSRIKTKPSVLQEFVSVLELNSSQTLSDVTERIKLRLVECNKSRTVPRNRKKSQSAPAFVRPRPRGGSNHVLVTPELHGAEQMVYMEGDLQGNGAVASEAFQKHFEVLAVSLKHRIGIVAAKCRSELLISQPDILDALSIGVSNQDKIIRLLTKVQTQIKLDFHKFHVFLKVLTEVLQVDTLSQRMEEDFKKLTEHAEVVYTPPEWYNLQDSYPLQLERGVYCITRSTCTCMSDMCEPMYVSQPTVRLKKSSTFCYVYCWFLGWFLSAIPINTPFGAEVSVDDAFKNPCLYGLPFRPESLAVKSLHDVSGCG